MFTFIANLKPYTYSVDDPEAAFSAYLLSVDYAGPHRTLARQVVDGGRTLCADNGNFARVEAVAAQFRAEADALNRERDAAELKRKKRFRPNEIPDALRDRYRDLAARVRVAAEAALPQTTIDATLLEQEALAPSYSIRKAEEDFNDAREAAKELGEEAARQESENELTNGICQGELEQANKDLENALKNYAPCFIYMPQHKEIEPPSADAGDPPDEPPGDDPAGGDDFESDDDGYDGEDVADAGDTGDEDGGGDDDGGGEDDGEGEEDDEGEA